MKLVFILLIICLIPAVFALEVSPSEINFRGVNGEVICKSVAINGVDGDDVVIENRWADEGYDDRDFSRYKLDGNYLGLDVDYEKNSIDDEIVSEVCVSGEREGVYHGVLLFREEGTNSGVGVWVVVDLAESDVIFLKGVFVDYEEGFGGGRVLVLVLVFVLIMLAGILAGVSVNFKKGN